MTMAAKDTSGTIPYTTIDNISVCIARWETGVRKIPSFLHLALRCLELEGGDLSKRATTTKRKGKGGVDNG